VDSRALREKRISVPSVNVQLRPSAASAPTSLGSALQDWAAVTDSFWQLSA
jgi:hypothetical protein